MISATLDPASAHRLDALASMLTRYVEVSGKTLSEVLEKKGAQLGRALYRGFRSRRWGQGPGTRGMNGIAWKEFRERVQGGAGLKVSPKTDVDVWSKGAPFTVLRHFETVDRRGRIRPASAATRTPLNRRQLAVYAELMRRQAGIGALAASFLWYRSRSSQARGTYYVRNKAGHPLGSVERTRDSLRIVGLTPGLARVDARYGIVARAITEVMADTAVYLARKLDVDLDLLSRQAGLLRAA